MAQDGDPRDPAERMKFTDEGATRRFYDLIWPLRADVLRIARILTGQEAEAEDLAQETLLKAFRFIDQFKEGTDARAWLMTILRNTRIDRLRSASSSAGQVSLESLAQEPAHAPATTGAATAGNPEHDPAIMLDAFGDAEIIAALQTLPEEIRWTLLLVDVEQLDQKEAADVSDVPVGTVKSRLHRGRSMLREMLLPVARDRRLVED